MGLISGIQAITAVQKIKQGGTAKLSIAQIAELIINLPDAQKNTTKDQFDKIYDLYREHQKCKTKLPHNYETYVATAIKIIKLFDAIAPYEKYSGGNELEFSYFMNEIRGE
jgi:hypothetical protein